MFAVTPIADKYGCGWMSARGALFDGPHTKVDQYDGVVTAQAALEKSYVLIVDDWNWQQVRDGTLQALVKTNSRIESLD